MIKQVLELGQNGVLLNFRIGERIFQVGTINEKIRRQEKQGIVWNWKINPHTEKLRSRGWGNEWRKRGEKWVYLKLLFYTIFIVGLSTISCAASSDFLDITLCSKEDFQSDFLGAIFNTLVCVC